ncbi:F-box domain containing protein [Tanacetum coccineum]|uniref:F-box domain containing protein n=1 Tax=Tanacetum coccineum TaxID=301880 RepID=A0ABQ4YWB4_9ASTR
MEAQQVMVVLRVCGGFGCWILMECNDKDRKVPPISDVDSMLDDISVQARCISIWHSHRINAAHNPYSLDMVLQDAYNNRIQNGGRLPLLPHRDIVPLMFAAGKKIPAGPRLKKVDESKQAGTTDLVFEPTKGPFLEFLRKKPLSRYSIVRIEARGSCNGLICLSQDEGHVITSLVVIHPLRKECYELPCLPLCFENHMRRESCGLGFDAFTNTYKMVCVLLKEYMPPNKPDMVKKNLCTMVHVFGTNSWREIPQVPSYPITGKSVFANCCLHWLVSYIDIKTKDGGREVIWFDVNKEEFSSKEIRTEVDEEQQNRQTTYSSRHIRQTTHSDSISTFRQRIQTTDSNRQQTDADRPTADPDRADSGRQNHPDKQGKTTRN